MALTLGAAATGTVAWTIYRDVVIDPAFVAPPAAPAPRSAPLGPGPTVRGIRISADRVEVGQDIVLTADVEPSPLATSSLNFRWTSDFGTFVGDGPSVKWHVPAGAVATPADVFIKLDLVERYPDFEAAWPPATKERHVEGAAPAFRLNDSIAELTKMAHAFLVDYFGHSAVSPEACLVDYTDDCTGKADELADVIENRRKFIIDTAEATVDHIDFNPPRSYAEIVGPCKFTDHERATGLKGVTVGDCVLTAVYITNRWWLCESHLRGRHTELSYNLLPDLKKMLVR
ncbi:MAG: hypothetical protein ABI652_01760 [Acidobacteriota bacterium]